MLSTSASLLLLPVPSGALAPRGMAARQLWERELQDEDDALARYEARLA